MRLMQIVSHKGFNGALKYCSEMAVELAARGHDVTVVCVGGSWVAEQLPASSGVSVVQSDLHRWPGDELRRIGQLFCDGQFDIVHTHNSRAHFFGVLLRHLYGIPCLATAHQNHFQLHWALNDYVIANSAATLRFQRWRNFVRPSRSGILHYPIDTQRFTQVSSDERARVRAELGLAEDDLALGIVGNVEPRKGHHYLIRALPEILKTSSRARLVIVGQQRSRYMPRVNAEIAAAGVQNEIIWAGYRADMPAVMHALDVCVCAALEEAFGLTAAEALAARRPVVATRVGGLPDSVVHGENGFLVPPKNPSALAEAIGRLLSDAQLRNRFGTAGQQRVERLFSREAHYSGLEQLYQRVRGHRRSLFRLRRESQPPARRAA